MYVPLLLCVTFFSYAQAMDKAGKKVATTRSGAIEKLLNFDSETEDEKYCQSHEIILKNDNASAANINPSENVIRLANLLINQNATKEELCTLLNRFENLHKGILETVCYLPELGVSREDITDLIDKLG